MFRLNKIKAVVLCWCLCGVFASYGQDAVSYTEVHTTAEGGLGKSGLVSALVGPGQDTTAVLQSVTALRIIGTLNGTDCLLLRNKMLNLEHLDMTQVEFVEGGNAYYSNYTTKPGSFPKALFNQCVASSKLKTVNLPNSITEIEASAFKQCSNLQQVTMGENLEKIGLESFYGCAKLDSVGLDNKLKSIGSYAFAVCSQLSHIVFPDSLVRIEANAFDGCKLTEVILPDSVQYLGANCFQKCKNIVRVDFGRLTTVPNNCFLSCSSLSEFPFSQVTSIGSSAFSGCSSLKTVELSNEIKNLSASVFANCTKLNRVVLPSALETIGANAFFNCSSLTDLRLPSSIKSLGAGFVNGCNMKLHVPSLNPMGIAPGTFSVGTNGAYSKITLCVPTISYYAYYWDNVWGMFRNILPEVVQYDQVELNSNCLLSKEMPGFVSGAENQIGYYSTELTLILNATASLTVGEDVSQGFNVAKLVSQTDSHPSLINHGGLRVNQLNLEIPIKGGEWRLFSFPRNGSKVSASGKMTVNLPSNAEVRVYDGGSRASSGSGWTTYTGNVFEVGKGYAIYVPANSAITCSTTSSTLVETDLDVVLSDNTSGSISNGGWNMVGNPYCSYYSIDDLGITDPVVVYNGQRKQYETYYPGADQYLLSPYEAFFVKKSSATKVLFKIAKRQVRGKGGAAAQQLRKVLMAPSGDGSNPPEPVVNSKITVSCDPEDAGAASGSGLYLVGNQATLSVVPQAGFQVDHWTVNGTYYAGSYNSIDYSVVSGNAKVVAVMKERTSTESSYNPSFPDDPSATTPVQSAQVPLYLKVSPSGTASFNRTSGGMTGAGELVHLKCTPNKNFTFKGWYQSGSLISTAAEFDFMMPNRAITLLASVGYSPSNPNEPVSTVPTEEIDNGQGVILGDVNEDGTVDVTDAVTLVNYLKDPSTDPERLILLRCDVNLDDVVDFDDVSAIVEKYLDQDRAHLSAADTLVRQDTIADVIALTSIVLEPGGSTAEVQFNLTSSTEYTAFAFDVLLPEGLEADTAMVVSPCSTHSIKYNLLQDDGQVLRFACFNTNNDNFPTSLSVLLRLPVSAPAYTYPDSLEIKLRHTTLITSAAQAFVPSTEGNKVTISEHNHIPVVISAANKYGTLILPFDADLPEGLRAAEGLTGNDTCLYLTEVTRLEPFTPYIVYAPSGINTAIEGDYQTEHYVSSVTKGYLTGVLQNTKINEGYVMQNQGKGAAFYMVLGADVVLPAGKVYLKQPGGASPISMYRSGIFDFGDDIPTAIEGVLNDKKEERLYNLQGIRVEGSSIRGLYLKSGNKYFVR